MRDRRRHPSAAIASALVVCSLLLVGCGNDGSSDGAADDGASATTAAGAPTTTTFDMPADELVDETGKPVVEIVSVDNTFEPRYVEVSAGTKVVWRNGGRNNHDILPDVEGAFPGVKAGDMPPGATHAVTFDTAGDFPYYCSTHGTMKNGMNGAIRVVPAG